MQDVIDTFSAYLSNLVAALAILVIGWLIAAIIAGKSGIRKVVTVSGAHKPGTLASARLHAWRLPDGKARY